MFIQRALFSLMTMCLLIGKTLAQNPAECVPGWEGTLLIDGENLSNWANPPEYTPNSFGSMALVSGPLGNAVQLNWRLGPATTDYVQARYDFKPAPIDLSAHDIFGLSVRGSNGPFNLVAFMFADVNNVFYGVECKGLNQIQDWMKNLALPKKQFYNFWPAGAVIDWSRINRFFVVVKRPKTEHKGGSGQLAIDHLQAGRAADWPRQQQFEKVRSNEAAKADALRFIFAQQASNGLFASWREESPRVSHLYDQALALIVLTREGAWQPANEAAVRAQRLAHFINAFQNAAAGRWPRHWEWANGRANDGNQWVGDQAWWIMALTQYFHKSGDSTAWTSAQRGAEWLAKKIDHEGKVIGPDTSAPNAVTNTEGTADTWWAMVCAKRHAEADLLQSYLLKKVWDADLKYWWRGYEDPGVALDCATWVAEFAKAPRVNQPERARQALSFVRRALITKSDRRPMCGFDGAGPVSVWSEGTAQYIVAGGEGAQQFLDSLLTLQDQISGGMPGSTDSVAQENCYVWLTRWRGISSTAWLYFALTGSPFPFEHAVSVAAANQIEAVDFSIEQNYPNPFNPSTTMRFSIPRPAYARLKVFDVNGREVASVIAQHMQAGSYEKKWEARDLPSGIYFYRLHVGEFVAVRKLVLVR